MGESTVVTPALRDGYPMRPKLGRDPAKLVAETPIRFRPMRRRANRAGNLPAQILEHLKSTGLPDSPLPVTVHIRPLEPGQLTVEITQSLGQVPYGRFDIRSLGDIDQGHRLVAFLELRDRIRNREIDRRRSRVSPFHQISQSPDVAGLRELGFPARQRPTEPSQVVGRGIAAGADHDKLQVAPTSLVMSRHHAFSSAARSRANNSSAPVSAIVVPTCGLPP
jgi:hypothetical protein